MLVNKLGIGTVQFGLHYGVSNTDGKTTTEEVRHILQAAVENNIRFLDTASAYGDAEKVLGENDLAEFSVVSKFISPSLGKSIEEQFKQTLTQLNVTNIYGYLAHRPAEILNDPGQWLKLKQLQSQQLIKKIGFSLNSPDELEALLEKNYIPDLIQVPYNYLDNRFEPLLISLKKQGCEIHSRSAFLQGLFFMRASSLPDFFNSVKPIIEQLQQIENLPGALLRFVASKPFIDRVIVGVETSRQLIQNIANLTIGKDLPTNTLQIPPFILMPSNWPKQ